MQTACITVPKSLVEALLGERLRKEPYAIVTHGRHLSIWWIEAQEDMVAGLWLIEPESGQAFTVVDR